MKLLDTEPPLGFYREVLHSDTGKEGCWTRDGLMNYRKGDRVKHPVKEDWGLGEVLENCTGDNVRIFFVGAGEKTLSLKYVEPVKVVGGMAEHPVLDNLKVSMPESGIRYQSLPQSIQKFLEQFPEGFYGERFKASERDYKDNAHSLAEQILERSQFASLLADNEYSEIAKRALKLVNATNLIFPNEKMALKDGLADPASKTAFGDTLFAVLYTEDDPEKRFVDFSRVLDNIDAGKWTIATYFPFIVHPDKFMFIKPTVTKHAAELCGFEINYKPHLNWRTYKSVLSFSYYLFTEISELKPRDMIDVQSFMWCIAPGTYKNT